MRAFLTIPLILLAVALLVLTGKGVAQDPLTSVAAIRTLTPEQAANEWPVHFEAQVIFLEHPGTVFVQDDTGGTFFRQSRQIDRLRPGDLVRITGVTFPGLYLTGVQEATFEVLGHSPLPPAQPVTWDDLASGRFHYQRVTARGVARTLAPLDENRALLRVALGSQILEVRVDAPPPDADSWVDALVQVTGLAAGGINERRQLVQPYLRASDWGDVQRISDPRAPSQLPEVSADQMLRFRADSSEPGPPHRVRVIGMVLASFADGRLFIRDQRSDPPTALAAWLSTPSSSLQPGTEIDLAGFPEMGGFSARLRDAIVLSSTPGPAPAPQKIQMSALPSAALDGELVTVEGSLLQMVRSAEGFDLQLVDGANLLHATLPASQMAAIETGSLVAVTGICEVQSATESGFRARPGKASLLLRTSADLTLLRAPPWWTPRRLAGLVVLLLSLMAIALIWISLLRIQLSRQARILRHRITSEAVLQERQRIAREFHDTLEQELAGLTLRLDAAGSRPLDDKTRALITTSRRLVSRVQTEARNLVADLRSPPDTPADLHLALSDLATSQPESAPKIELRTTGDLPALPAHVIHHLRMIAQEGVTNALKHSHGTLIQINLSATLDELILEIRDDGCGADLSRTSGLSGHFGCMGIRERCLKLGAQALWQSATGKGTRLTVTLPLPLSLPILPHDPPSHLARR